VVSCKFIEELDGWSRSKNIPQGLKARLILHALLQGSAASGKVLTAAKNLGGSSRIHWADLTARLKNLRKGPWAELGLSFFPKWCKAVLSSEPGIELH
jgi:hypothetical protein